MKKLNYKILLDHYIALKKKPKSKKCELCGDVKEYNSCKCGNDNKKCSHCNHCECK